MFGMQESASYPLCECKVRWRIVDACYCAVHGSISVTLGCLSLCGKIKSWLMVWLFNMTKHCHLFIDSDVIFVAFSREYCC